MKAFIEYVKGLDSDEFVELRERLNEVQSCFESLSEESNSDATQLILDKVLDLLECMDKVEEGNENDIEEEDIEDY